MTQIRWLDRIFSKKNARPSVNAVLPAEDQIGAWRIAARKMRWPIGDDEYRMIVSPPQITEGEIQEGFSVMALFYGFGDDGSGNADSVASGKIAWAYARKRLKNRTWQSPLIDFHNADSLRLRPGAPPRPKGFYFANVRAGEGYRKMTASQARRSFTYDTGCGPEGLQLLCITHPHIPGLMSDRKTPFMILADYDFAPYGHNDFFDTLQIFSSNGILGLGIGHVEQHYPGFRIPSLRICL